MTSACFVRKGNVLVPANRAAQIEIRTRATGCGVRRKVDAPTQREIPPPCMASLYAGQPRIECRTWCENMALCGCKRHPLTRDWSG